MNSGGKHNAGLFGGTFDPVHLGHLRAAEEIREIFGLAKVYFIPSAIPPHKLTVPITDPAHRLEMLKLAVSSNPHFDTCDYEIEKKTTSYTVETLRHLTESQPDFEYYFIVGHELFSEIETWREYKELFTLSNFVVITRPGFSNGTHRLPLALKADFSYDKREDNVTFYKNNDSKIIAFTQIRGLEISSTEIRRYVKGEKSVRYLVPDTVEEYIMSNKIYHGEEVQ